MTYSFRKDSNVSRGVKIAICSAALACAISAHAQSQASYDSQMSYSFSLDDNSLGFAGDLIVQDNGLLAYNLFNGDSAPFTSTTGNASASAGVNPSSNYDGSSWSGFSRTNGSASSSPEGSSAASAGLQENLELSNSGLSVIQIDISAAAGVFGSAFITGPSSSGNYASVQAYAGIFDFNLSTLEGVNPLVHVGGSDLSPVETDVTADWSPIDINGATYYTGSYVLTLNPGETHLLSFYTSGKVTSGASTAVPTPATIVPMLIGLVGLIGRRRKLA